jgi:hypothetical protein
VSLQKSRKDAREAEETRQYLEDLNNLDLDEDLHEMPAELEMFNVSKTPTTLSSAGCRKSFDSTTEEPTNLSSYSTLVYGN